MDKLGKFYLQDCVKKKEFFYWCAPLPAVFAVILPLVAWLDEWFRSVIFVMPL